jgi:hypothetical protein
MSLWSPRAYPFSITDPNSWPLIPIPEVATDPNGGTTYGLMAVFLNHKPDGSVSSIIAPDVTNNGTLGPGGRFGILAILLLTLTGT